MMCKKSLLTAAIVLAATQSATAHVVLSQKTFEAGVNFAAFFTVEHGCDGSPTLALRVDIPEGVTVKELPPKDGWVTNAEKTGSRVSAISWRGRLEGGEKGQFPVLLQLPARTGPLYFPAVQRCAKGEMRWTQIPTAQSDAKLERPAPVVVLTEPVARPAAFMAGDVMVIEAWSRATPPGVKTGAGYLTIMNHGTLPEILTGGSTPLADKLEIHRTTTVNGVTSMRPAADGVTIPPGATLSLKPIGEFHVMLSGLKAPLTAGSRVPMTLTFLRAGKLDIEATVEPIGALGPSTGDAGHDHH